MLTQNGIDYICQNFGDASFCCTNIGLSWYYTSNGVDYHESGGTAQIVSRLASGLIDSLTMKMPSRGIFTQVELNSANQGAVTLQDAQQITNHDEPSEDQWCYTGPPPPSCEDYITEAECIANGCYWENNACYASPTPPPPEEIPWLPIALGVGIVAAVGFGYYLTKKRK